MKVVFKLYTNIIPVKGAKRSSLCDLQRGRIKLIPNDLYTILTLHRDAQLESIKASYAAAEAPIIDQYFSFLFEDEWGFWCENPEAFPDLDLSYDAPAQITNAIIDVGPSSHHDYADLVDQLEALGCNFLQIRAYVPLSLDQFRLILDASNNSRLRSIEMFCAFDPSQDLSALAECVDKYRRLYKLTLHGAPRHGSMPLRQSSKRALLVLQPEPIHSQHDCGAVDKSFFTSLLPAFSEALQFNSCLNRKLSIDAQGHIRNCPSLTPSYGHSRQVRLEEIAQDPEFQKIWHINKDQIEVCRDCEFRYVCSDCRAYTHQGAPYGKPAKCVYNPYQAVWEAEIPMAMSV